MSSEPEQLRELKNAWLSPSGEIVVDAEDFAPIGAWHEELAQCLVRDLLGLKSARDAREEVAGAGKPHAYVYEWLEARGWIRYSHWNLRWVVATRMTDRQQEVIEAWCAANNRTWQRSVDQVFEP
jgi:hypothetical protein